MAMTPAQRRQRCQQNGDVDTSGTLANASAMLAMTPARRGQKHQLDEGNDAN